MKNIGNLEALLAHIVQELYAAEEQLLQAMPAMIDKAEHNSLKHALQHHHELTKGHKSRLENVVSLLKASSDDSYALIERKICKGIQGLIEEAEELLSQDIAKDVMDAAIIACVQKIEHYEICAYGTALAYASSLQLAKVEALLEETLNEEYDADDLLTALATASYNKHAEPGQRKRRATEPAAELYTGENPHSSNTTNREIKSPGGRAGTSHRGYSTGESRGH